MENVVEENIKTPSFVHACIIWGVSIILNVWFLYVWAHPGDFSASDQSASLAWAGLGNIYLLILSLLAISKLLKAQNYFLKDRSFFRSEKMISCLLFLLFVLCNASSFFPVKETFFWQIMVGVTGLAFQLLFFLLLYFMLSGFSRLGVNGRWVLFFYLLLYFFPAYYPYLFTLFPEDWSLNLSCRRASGNMVLSSLYLGFVFLVKQSIFSLKQKLSV